MAKRTYMENGVEMCGPGYTKQEYDDETNAANYPETLTLRFENADAKKSFLTGICDSWGENYCFLHWKWLDGETLDTAQEMTVTVFDDDESEG